MKYSALIGNPTAHSISHIMYEELAVAAGVEDSYKHLKIDLEIDELPDALTSFKRLKFVGINVTLPYKLEIMKYMDRIDETAKAVGAINTVAFDKYITGHNTDWIGIVTPILNKLNGRTVNNVVIFGTGGAARAAIYAAQQLQAKGISVLYRSSHQQALGDLVGKADELGIEFLDYDHLQAVAAKSDVIINATSAGMVGKDTSPIDVAELDDINLDNKLFFDVVFNPVLTPLLQYFDSRGVATIDGLWMMIHQGIAAMEIWLNRSIFISDQELERIHARLIKELRNV